MILGIRLVNSIDKLLLIFRFHFWVWCWCEIDFKSLNTLIDELNAGRVCLLYFVESANLHVEDKCTALTDSLRINAHGSATFFDDLFDDCEAEPDAFMIQVSGPMKLSKLGEQLALVILCDTSSSVNYMHHEAF